MICFSFLKAASPCYQIFGTDGRDGRTGRTGLTDGRAEGDGRMGWTDGKEEKHTKTYILLSFLACSKLPTVPSCEIFGIQTFRFCPAPSKRGLMTRMTGWFIYSFQELGRSFHGGYNSKDPFKGLERLLKAFEAF